MFDIPPTTQSPKTTAWLDLALAVAITFGAILLIQRVLAWFDRRHAEAEEKRP